MNTDCVCCLDNFQPEWNDYTCDGCNSVVCEWCLNNYIIRNKKNLKKRKWKEDDGASNVWDVPCFVCRKINKKIVLKYFGF